MLETDGPYGGQSCSSTDHAHHNGLEDSVYRQTQLQGTFFLRLREMGVYLNVPDTFFFQGQNRIAMGYNEHQYSLPRWKQLTISRMGMYDDFYRYLPTQGWMFVPLSEYHRGGDAATFANHPVRLLYFCFFVVIEAERAFSKPFFSFFFHNTSIIFVILCILIFTGGVGMGICSVFRSWNGSLLSRTLLV